MSKLGYGVAVRDATLSDEEKTWPMREISSSIGHNHNYDEQNFKNMLKSPFNITLVLKEPWTTPHRSVLEQNAVLGILLKGEENIKQLNN